MSRHIPRPDTSDQCTVDGVTVNGHYCKNTAERGKPPVWTCERCGTVKRVGKAATV